jgi:hypothetical protein
VDLLTNPSWETLKNLTILEAIALVVFAYLLFVAVVGGFSVLSSGPASPPKR